MSTQLKFNEQAEIENMKRDINKTISFWTKRALEEGKLVFEISVRHEKATLFEGEIDNHLKIELTKVSKTELYTVFALAFRKDTEEYVNISARNQAFLDNNERLFKIAIDAINFDEYDEYGEVRIDPTLFDDPSGLDWRNNGQRMKWLANKIMKKFDIRVSYDHVDLTGGFGGTQATYEKEIREGIVSNPYQSKGQFRMYVRGLRESIALEAYNAKEEKAKSLFSKLMSIFVK